MRLVDLETGNVVLRWRTRGVVGVSASAAANTPEPGFVEYRARRGAAVSRCVGAARSLKGLAALVRRSGTGRVDGSDRHRGADGRECRRTAPPPPRPPH